MLYRCRFLSLVMMLSTVNLSHGADGVLIGHVLDDTTGDHLPARVYVTGTDGKPYLPVPRTGESIAHYDVTRGPREIYASIGAHPFHVEVPAGKCVVTVERGKEYPPVTRTVTIAEGRTAEAGFRMTRKFNMAAKGWYSGDLHVHSRVADLPIVQLAEDLNVAFPITAWARDSEQVPDRRGGKVPERGRLVSLDDTHVYWNLNTEYEIFTVKGERWTQGAILILGHTSPFEMKAPPIGPVATEARRQGAILDWDKHSWPWSTMLVPAAKIDTIELSNNHMWRLKPHFLLWGEQPPAWMNCTEDAAGWAEYGFQSYYALLNSGFDLCPSAGTANGVHPVPLGHSRVYVKIDGPFTYEKWVAGLRKGRSFATNGPMLFLNVDGMEPGERRAIPAGQTHAAQVEVEAWSVRPLDRIELILNGTVAHRFKPDSSAGHAGVDPHRFRAPVELVGSSWIAARCFEIPPADNVRFAHTGPIFFDDPSRPIRPHKRQITYLIDSVAAQIKRNPGKLSDAAMAEYRAALQAYRAIDEAGPTVAPTSDP